MLKLTQLGGGVGHRAGAWVAAGSARSLIAVLGKAEGPCALHLSCWIHSARLRNTHMALKTYKDKKHKKETVSWCRCFLPGVGDGLLGGVGGFGFLAATLPSAQGRADGPWNPAHMLHNWQCVGHAHAQLPAV